MSQNVRSTVLRLLKGYPTMQRKIALLRYEMEHPSYVTPEEMIGTMNFAKGEGSGLETGHVSNKTLYIALNYQQRADQENADMMNELAARLLELERDERRLEHHVALLDRRKADVIRLSYFEQKSWEEVGKALGVAIRTAQIIRRQAVDELVKMYEYTDILK